MGAGGTIAGIGIAAIAIGGLAYAAIKYLPGLLSGIGLPKLDLPEDPFNLDQYTIRVPGPGRAFTPDEIYAFSFREAIGRPELIMGETFTDPQGRTRIVQSDPAAIYGRKIYGSDFASAERLSDLSRRFISTGRIDPTTGMISHEGRRARIASLLSLSKSRSLGVSVRTQPTRQVSSGTPRQVSRSAPNISRRNSQAKKRSRGR